MQLYKTSKKMMIVKAQLDTSVRQANLAEGAFCCMLSPSALLLESIWVAGTHTTHRGKFQKCEIFKLQRKYSIK